MKITVITQCTGQKAVTDPNQLTMEDFRKGAEHVAHRTESFNERRLSAEVLYTGQQHLRLMRGVRQARENGAQVDVWVVSAGYGMVRSEDLLAPYEATFNDLSKRVAIDWANQLGIPQAISSVLSRPADVAIVLLGGRYLECCRIDRIQELGAPTIALCGQSAVRQFPAKFHPWVLQESDTRRFKVGMVGIKGEVAGRLLAQLPAADPMQLFSQMRDAI